MKTLGLVQIVCSGLIAILFSSTTVLAADGCFGVPTDAPRNEICMRQTTEKSCLSKFAYEGDFIYASCRWTMNAGAVNNNIQNVYTRYGTTWFSNAIWPKGVTSYSMKMTLPTSAKSKWSGYLSMQSGPGNNTAATKYMDPTRSFTFSGCQTGTVCVVNQTIPKNVFPTATFRNTGMTFTVLTTDPVLINQFNTNGYVDETYPFKLELETTYTTPAGNPPATPALTDTVQFGPTDYIMDEISPTNPKQHYSVVTYKSYEVSNVAEARWKVTVGASIPSSGKKTSMTSMLMTEKNYYQYLGKCSTTCKPPTTLAIKGTVCTGLTCSGRATSLITTEKYRLVVSYPTITSLSSTKAYSTKPMTSTFNKQMVKTEISGRGWKLSPTKTATSPPPPSSSSPGTNTVRVAPATTTTTLI